MADWTEPARALEEFGVWLARQPLAERSAREYLRNVRAFCGWLEATPDRDGWAADPLTDPIARDHAVRDFRRFLQVERRAAPATVNLALASLDALFRQRELGRPNVRRDKPAEAGPRALDVEQQRRLLRAAEHATERDRAIVAVLLYTALRLNELVALDLEDVPMTARKGQVLVRSGKGEKTRQIPLNALVRQDLEQWIEARRAIADPDERALFVARAGRRLSARATDTAIRKVGQRAGLELSAHVLRHTCLTGLVRQGTDLVTVAALAGHSRLETTRRYSLPSEADRARALEDLQIDF